jgi:hypothetical protein
MSTKFDTFESFEEEGAQHSSFADTNVFAGPPSTTTETRAFSP